MNFATQIIVEHLAKDPDRSSLVDDWTLGLRNDGAIAEEIGADIEDWFHLDPSFVDPQTREPYWYWHFVRIGLKEVDWTAVAETRYCHV